VGGSGAGSWRFVDSSGPHLLAKAALSGSMTVPAQGYVILAGDAPTFLKEHPNFSGILIDTVMNLKNNQDVIKLQDGSGVIVSEAFWVNSMGAAGNGRTLEFSKGIWREGLRDGGSPGLENSIENVILPEAPTPSLALSPSPLGKNETSFSPRPLSLATPSPKPLNPAVLIINEFLPNPKGDDSTGEWIEIKNAGANIADLSGWTLTTDSSSKTFPLSGTVQPGGYLLVRRQDSRLTLRNTADRITLKNPEGKVASEIRYENEIPEGWSAAKFPEGWRLTKTPTPGQENILEEDAGEEAPKVSLGESARTEAGGAKLLQEEKHGEAKRLPWILGVALALGGVAAGLAIFLKKKVLL
jgi:hypothetical protein